MQRTENDGERVAALVMALAASLGACADPSGQMPSDDDSSGTSGPSTTTGAEETTVDPDSSTGPEPQPECLQGRECPADAPACVEGTCQPCDGALDPDAVCASVDPTRPVCDSGQCVQCTEANVAQCGGFAPTCNPETSQCVECRFHLDCPGTACDLEAGTCFTAAETVSIGYSSSDEAWPMITQTAAEIPEGERRALLLDGPTYHAENVVITGDRAVALIHSGTTSLGPDDPDGEILRVEAGARVYLHAVGLSGGLLNTGAVTVDDAGLWVDDGTITGVVGPIVEVRGGGDLYLRNAGIRGLGPSTAVSVIEGTADVHYSTLFGRDSGGHGIACSPDNATVAVRNSLMLAAWPATAGIECDTADVRHSAMTGVAPGGGVGNAEYEDYDYDWFQCESPGGNCVSFWLDLGGQQAFEGLARWEFGDPGWDFDGGVRPSVPGSPDYAGVDVPPS
ncbi:MAG: hypothetical protein K0V04_26650 [Deltaproteobacteria bacterium]|nr:hypothetical protein [Deltaproteobacteria bacterium]